MTRVNAQLSADARGDMPSYPTMRHMVQRVRQKVAHAGVNVQLNPRHLDEMLQLPQHWAQMQLPAGGAMNILFHVSLRSIASNVVWYRACVTYYDEYYDEYLRQIIRIRTQTAVRTTGF